MKLFVTLAVALAAGCSDSQATNHSTPHERLQQLATKAAPKVTLTGRVTDATDTLSAAQEATLAAKLERLERATGHQMVIVTVTSLDGQEVADFTRDLANAWGIGRADQDDGVVLLVAPKEHKMRIAVGLGLEKTLTPSVCQNIIDEQILPHFREGDLAAGIEAGTSALVDHLT